MFISRKSRKISRNDIFNQSINNQQSNDNNDVQIISFPMLQYFLGVGLIGFSIYMIYSASGGINGIAGFRQGRWWQYIIAAIPMIFGLSFILACQIQSLVLSRKNNIMIVKKTRCFCYVTQQIRKQFVDLMGISVIKSKDKSIANYQIVLSFNTCDQISILRCVSQSKIIEYFQEIRSVFTKQEISQKRVAILNMLQ